MFFHESETKIKEVSGSAQRQLPVDGKPQRSTVVFHNLPRRLKVAFCIGLVIVAFIAPALVQGQRRQEELLDGGVLLTVDRILGEDFTEVEQSGILSRLAELTDTVGPDGFYLIPFELEQLEVGTDVFPSESGSVLDRAFQLNLSLLSQVIEDEGRAQLVLAVRLHDGQVDAGTLTVQVTGSYVREATDSGGQAYDQPVAEGSFWIIDDDGGGHLLQRTTPYSQVGLVEVSEDYLRQIRRSVRNLGSSLELPPEGSWILVELDTNENTIQVLSNIQAFPLISLFVDGRNQAINVRALPGTQSEIVGALEIAPYAHPYQITTPDRDGQSIEEKIKAIYPNAEVILRVVGFVAVNIGDVPNRHWIAIILQDDTPEGTVAFVASDVMPNVQGQRASVPTQSPTVILGILDSSRVIEQRVRQEDEGLYQLLDEGQLSQVAEEISTITGRTERIYHSGVEVDLGNSTLIIVTDLPIIRPITSFNFVTGFRDWLRRFGALPPTGSSTILELRYLNNRTFSGNQYYPPIYGSTRQGQANFAIRRLQQSVTTRVITADMNDNYLYDFREREDHDLGGVIAMILISLRRAESGGFMQMTNEEGRALSQVLNEYPYSIISLGGD